MTNAANRAQLSIRMNLEDRDLLADEAATSGLDVSAAARMVLELTLQRIRAGGDLLDAVHEMKNCFSEAEKKEAA